MVGSRLIIKKPIPKRAPKPIPKPIPKKSYPLPLSKNTPTTTLTNNFKPILTDDSQKKISIVIAYYNRKKLLEYTLKLIELSIHKNIEIIIVDDASNDVEALDNIINNYKLDITLIKIKKSDKTHMNPCVPYNIGFRKATGEIIIIQNPEVCHIGDVCDYVNKNIKPNEYMSFTCANLELESYNPVLHNTYNKLSDYSSVIQYIAKLQITHKNGFAMWYNHPKYRPCYFNFLCAIHKKDLDEKLNGGFDERYASGSAMDDKAFVKVARYKGLNMNMIDIINDAPFGIHQWHAKAPHNRNKNNVQINVDIYNSHMKSLGISP